MVTKECRWVWQIKNNIKNIKLFSTAGQSTLAKISYTIQTTEQISYNLINKMASISLSLSLSLFLSPLSRFLGVGFVSELLQGPHEVCPPQRYLWKLLLLLIRLKRDAIAASIHR